MHSRFPTTRHLHSLPIALLIVVAALVARVELGLSQDQPGGSAVAETGLTHRTHWTTSNVRGFPDPPPPLRVVPAYPLIKLKNLVALSSIPHSDWLLAVDHDNDYAGASHVVQFRDSPDAAQSEVFLETPEIIYGLAFHPQFASNGWVYVGCNGRSETLDAVATRVIRYRVLGSGPFRCDPASRQVVIEWKSNGHNGGDLVFGNDGMLYVSAGDGTSDSDVDRNGQNLSTLPGSLLRIDVNVDLGENLPNQSNAPPPYRIPADNPFVAQAGARGEIWAYGLRNPWRISFDPQSNQLWVGNNGQDVWESVYLIERGANYGWSINESNHPFHTQQDHGPVDISPATLEHHHSEARSLTGGHVYRGQQFPELQGAYLYGDYSTGNIWAARHDGQQINYRKLIARSRIQITDFGVDTQGEVLIADHAGTIYRLSKNTETATPSFPKRLSQTGLFSDVSQEQPAAGVIAYQVNSPLWSDGALKKRWLAIPGQTTIGFTPRGSWDFPEGTVLVKSFAFAASTEKISPSGATLPRQSAVDASEPSTSSASHRLVETRLFTKQQGEWYGYSYRWNDSQTDAELVADTGLDETLDWIVEDGQPLTLKWRYPSRSECMVCHSRAAKFVLGVSTEQMNRLQDYHQQAGIQVSQQAVLAPQIATLAHIGLFGDTFHADAAPQLPQLVDPADTSQELAARARSYLHANCASCHVEAGGGNSKIVLDFFTPLNRTGLVDTPPLHSNLGIEAARLLSPGAPERSILQARLARRGEGQMPPLATQRCDPLAVELMRQWIAQAAQ